MSNSALKCPPLLTPEEYLEAEELSPIKHEYLNGVVHAMSGGRNIHALISTNILAFLHARLRGKKCRPYNPDTKVRIRRGNALRFYSPDARIICKSNAPDEPFQDEPVAIFEVRSESTAR